MKDYIMKKMSQMLLTLCLSLALIVPCYAAVDADHASQHTPTAAEDTFWIENFTPLGIASYSRGDYVTGTLVAAADLSALYFLGITVASAVQIAENGDNGYGGLAMLAGVIYGSLSYGAGRGIGLIGHAVQNTHTTDYQQIHHRQDNFSAVPTLFTTDF